MTEQSRCCSRFPSSVYREGECLGLVLVFGHMYYLRNSTDCKVTEPGARMPGFPFQL